MTARARLTLIAVGSALAVLCSSSALAQPGPGAPGAAVRAACVAAFEGAQEQHNQDRPLAARAELARCAQPTCPTVVRQKCTEWLSEWASEIPEVLIRARGSDGRETAEVRVFVNERLVRDRLDGLPIELEPGAHRFRFDFADGGSVEQQLVLNKGQRGREIHVSVAPEQPQGPGGALQPSSAGGASDPVGRGDAASASAAAGLPTLAWVGVGVGGAGLVLGAVTGGVAMAEGSSLEEQCSQSGCTQEEIDAGTAIAHVSTAGFVVGAVGAVTALVAILAHESSAPSAGTARLRPWIGPNRWGIEGTF